MPESPRSPEEILQFQLQTAAGSYFELVGPFSAIGHMPLNRPMPPALAEARQVRNNGYDELLNVAAHARLGAIEDLERLQIIDGVIDDVLMEQPTVRNRYGIIDRIKHDIEVRTSELHHPDPSTEAA